MRKKVLYSAMVMAALTMCMTACGDGKEGAAGTMTQEEVKELAPEPLLSETESAIRDYELRYSMGEFVVEDYQALAALYQEQRLIRKQRDMLEQSYRLYQDEQAFETLQTISVNLAEEDEKVQEEARLMRQNLELDEYLDESINLISTEEWFRTMMPKLREGSRSYFLQQNGETVLLIQAGYDETGAAYSQVWYLGEQVKVLRHTGNAVQLLTTQLTDGNYQGAFESWTCDGNTGDIYHETGTFANGVLVGDYTAAIHNGTETVDLFSLWSNREGMEYTTYTGNFDERGVTTLEQPADKKITALIQNTDYSTCVVYAYDESRENCLFQGLPESIDATVYAFGIEAMGWKPYPAVTTYEVTETAETEETIETEDDVDDGMDADAKVRIFDGEIQLYLDGVWVGMGSVESYAEEDPFRDYENSRNNADNGDAGNAAAEQQPAFGKSPVKGKIPKDVTKPATKPSTQKPSQSQTTEQPATPEPTPEPTPAPAPAPMPSPAPSPAPAPAPTPEPTPAPSESGGNDVDVEWTPDIL